MKIILAGGLLAMVSYTAAMMIDGKQMTMDEAIMKAGSSQMFELMQDEKTVMVEMDILYDMDTYMAMREEMEEAEKDEQQGGGGRKKRKAIRSLQYRWTDETIPYEISYEMSATDRQTIQAAINDYHTFTCLRFRPARSTDRNRVRFQNGGGCSSYVGMIGGVQPISLAPGCRYKGIVIHEIGHAIGFHHEQTRPDRDNYVRIQSQNIQSSTLYNFMKYTSSQQNTYNVPYDYTSVMHYSQYAFSTNGRPSIYAVDRSYQNQMGNRDGLSYSDIQLANTMYSCPAKQGCASVSCPVNSFQGPNCKCWCNTGDRSSPIRECGTGTGTGGGSGTTTPPVTTAGPSMRCEDRSRYCPAWQRAGYCTATYVQYMMENCKYSCNYCDVPTTTTTTTTASPPVENCRDSNRYCEAWANNGECRRNPSYMLEYCKRSCEQCNDEGMGCMDTSQYCQGWANAGYCSNSVYRSYLEMNCALSCGACTSNDEVATTTPTAKPVVEDPNCMDMSVERFCLRQKNRGQCTNSPRTKTKCRKTCGLC